MSNLEKFIRNHREDFDDATPSVNVWENIVEDIEAKKRAKTFSLREVYKWSAVAAIFFIVLTSAYFLFIYNKKNSHENVVAEKQQPTQPVDPGSIAPEYAAQYQMAYRSVVNRQEELKTEASTQPQLYLQFQNDIKVLDSSFQMLKKQAEQSPNKDVIIQAMIQNLGLQAELLSRQLLIIKEVKKPQTQKNEKDI